MNTDKTNWTKLTCDNLDEVAKNLGIDLSGYPTHTEKSKDVNEVYDALLNKFGMYSEVLDLVHIDSIPTLDDDCYYELSVAPKFVELKEIA